MLFGISTSSFYPRLETERAAAEIARLNVDCMEAFLQCSFEYGAQYGALLRRVAQGVPVRSVHALSSRDEPMLFARSSRQRREALDTLKRVVDAGEALGAKYYVFHGQANVKHLATTRRPNFDQLAEGIMPLLECARGAGLGIAWETVYWSSFCFPDFAREMARRLPEIRFTLDIKQVAKTEYPLEAYLEAMGDRLVHLHVCDCRADGGLCLPGAAGGQFDFENLGAQLARRGYEGAVILEPYSDQFECTEQLARALDFLRVKVHAENGAGR